MTDQLDKALEPFIKISSGEGLPLSHLDAIKSGAGAFGAYTAGPLGEPVAKAAEVGKQAAVEEYSKTGDMAKALVAYGKAANEYCKGSESLKSVNFSIESPAFKKTSLFGTEEFDNYKKNMQAWKNLDKAFEGMTGKESNTKKVTH